MHAARLTAAHVKTNDGIARVCWLLSNSPSVPNYNYAASSQPSPNAAFRTLRRNRHSRKWLDCSRALTGPQKGGKASSIVRGR
jgi:hypothetical protein